MTYTSRASSLFLDTHHRQERGSAEGDGAPPQQQGATAEQAPAVPMDEGEAGAAGRSAHDSSQAAEPILGIEGG